MQVLFTNRTILTEDLYKKGIKENYKASHKLLRAFSTAYAIVMFFIGYLFLANFDFIVAIPFLLMSFAVFFWNFVGYKMAAKKSFKQFAKLHGSHYEVEMEYRFYEDHIEQETSKTELSVNYADISTIDFMRGMILIVFDKSVIIIDRNTMDDEHMKEFRELFEKNNVKTRNFDK